MSHEFRTPLHAIRALSGLLLEHADGPLGEEQEKQVRLIVKASKDLTELVDDLLDLARIAAGKEAVRPVEFELTNLFSALRGMLRPLLVSEQVRLVFDEAPAELLLFTDEGKVSQILRNLISNALKFTEAGEVRVRVEEVTHAEIALCVSDTGIGIRSEDRERIFEEFVQAPNRLQARVKGTGLGLPLCRRLSQLLGGRIWVQSEPGVGSSFHVRLPRRYRELPAEAPAPVPSPQPGLIPVLVVEDAAAERLLYEKYLVRSRYQCVSAGSLAAARRALVSAQPRAIVLDILLQGEHSWEWLAELKSSPQTRALPVIVATNVEDARKGLALGADAYLLKPLRREALLGALDAALGGSVLVIDDDPAARYIVQRLLSDSPVQVLEAADGESGLELARRCRPALIFLDLELPDQRGEAVLRALRAEAQTREIPVAILTAAPLAEAERARLGAQAQAVLHKSELDPRTARELLSRHGVAAA
jgi:CheY-like chemotaxis protein/two-component sensor histidine kinase